MCNMTQIRYRCPSQHNGRLNCFLDGGILDLLAWARKVAVRSAGKSASLDSVSQSLADLASRSVLVVLDAVLLGFSFSWWHEVMSCHGAD